MQMKKTLLLSGLLTLVVCLTACGSKTFDMSFEEAVEVASHSELQDILSQNDVFEQDFNLAGNFDYEGTKVEANISTNSKQNLDDKVSDSSTKFAANITYSGETIKLNWALDIRLVADALYLNLSALDLTWSDDLAMVGMLTEWFKNQWFSIPMTWLSNMPSSFSVFKDSEELNEKAKDIIVNEWSLVYNWKFTQFNGYNAWKFSIDNEKLNALMKEYYDSINTDLDEESQQEMPEINIENFEWYLVITWKKKVTTVIESMQMQSDDAVIDVDWFAGDDCEITLSSDGQPVVTIVANKKGSKYDVSLTIANGLILEWSISPKLSKSSINLKFDAKLTIKSEAEWGKDIVVPFNGAWKYNSISNFTTTAPEGAQDLTELLWAYLGGMMWWSDYDYEDYNYEDLEDIEYIEDDASLENLEDETANEVAEEAIQEVVEEVVEAE